MEARNSPLDGIDVRFKTYVDNKNTQNRRHMHGSIPDYAFASDYEFRKKLSQIPGFETVGRRLVSTRINAQMKNILRCGAVVNEKQFPDIYQMGVDCARRLGISIPQIVILNEPQMNAFTIATDEASPLVVINSGMVERCRSMPECLKAVIGHECGHIHNNHILYATIVNYFTTLSSAYSGLLTTANFYLMHIWNRAQEVTADRAGMICCDNIEDSEKVKMLLLSGGMFNTDWQMDEETLRRQYDEIVSTPVSYLEAYDEHPSTVRRYFCDKEFEKCEVLYQWRPDLKKPGVQTCTKEETDERCRRLVSIVTKGERKNG